MWTLVYKPHENSFAIPSKPLNSETSWQLFKRESERAILSRTQEPRIFWNWYPIKIPIYHDHRIQILVMFPWYDAMMNSYDRTSSGDGGFQIPKYGNLTTEIESDWTTNHSDFWWKYSWRQCNNGISWGIIIIVITASGDNIQSMWRFPKMGVPSSSIYRLGFSMK